MILDDICELLYFC